MVVFEAFRKIFKKSLKKYLYYFVGMVLLIGTDEEKCDGPVAQVVRAHP